MIVIADTSPINYLVLAQSQEVLHELFGRVIIPQAVSHELQSVDTPQEVREWIANPPEWLKVKEVRVPEGVGLEHLDEDERQAIVLAQELAADLLILDDKDARDEARWRNLTTTGTLGVLEKAAARGLLNLARVFDRLRQTTFRASEELYESFLERDAERKQREREGGRLKPSQEGEPSKEQNRNRDGEIEH